MLTRFACRLDFLSGGAAVAAVSELPTAATSCREAGGFQYSRLTGATPLPTSSAADKLLKALDMLLLKARQYPDLCRHTHAFVAACFGQPPSSRNYNARALVSKRLLEGV